VSSAAWAFAIVVYLTVAALAGWVLVRGLPSRPSKPKPSDELEALYTGLRIRIADLEDAYDRKNKREAGRESRAKMAGQGEIQFDREARLRAARDRARGQYPGKVS
jgi:hypothetical protein